MRKHRLLAASLILATGVAFAARAPAGSTYPEKTPDRYAAPGERVAIGNGRSLNLRCSGRGEPVVLLEAGANADASTWFRVHDALAATTRVCAYDRAGHGFSDAGPLPRGLDAAVADLEALLDAMRIDTPVVLVGHSLGSSIVRHFATLHPARVAGLVLVDPPEQDLGSRMTPQWRENAAKSRVLRDDFLATCLQAAERRAQQSPPAMPDGCLRTPPPWVSARVDAAMRENKQRPGYWHTLRSEFAQNDIIFGRRAPEGDVHGDLPLVVLAAIDAAESAPTQMREGLVAAREDTYRRLASTSSAGTLVEVPGSSHDIQIDRPEAVISAVGTVVQSKHAAGQAAPKGKS